MAIDYSWKMYTILTIDYTKVNASATDFPVYINDVSLPIGVFGSDQKSANSNGGDIRFTSDLSGVTELAREIAYFNKSGATGSKCAIYVKIPNLSSTVNTIIYMWYANSSANDYSTTDPYGRNATWSNNFRLVTHLYGSTINDSSGTVASTATVNGTVNFADASYGCRMTNSTLTTANFISFPYTEAVSRNGSLFGSVGAGNGATFEALCAPTDWDTDTTTGNGGRRHLITAGESIGTNGQSWGIWRSYETGNRFNDLEIRTGSGDSYLRLLNTAVAATDQWYYLAGIHTNESTDAYRSMVYGSGGQVQNDTMAPGASPFDVTDNTSAQIRIGTHLSYGTFLGNISEIRVSKNPREQSWVITTQENYFRPSTFITSGGELDRYSFIPKISVIIF
jgi:hypothetical protein